MPSTIPYGKEEVVRWTSHRGKHEGVRVSAKAYNYLNDEQTHHLFYGADLRYEATNWKLETEVMKRESKTDFHTDLLHYLQGAYVLPLNTKLFNSLIPALRWDGISDTQGDAGFDVKRLTAGLDSGATEVVFRRPSGLITNGTVTNSPSIFKSPEVGSDKITVELLLRF